MYFPPVLALIASLGALAWTPIQAQTSDSSSSPSSLSAPPKDPQLATILGVIMPGAGQLYAGRPIKGGLLIAGFSGAIVGGVASSCFGCCSYNSQTYQCKDNLTPYYTGLAVAAGLWIYGFVTAGDDAHRTNQKNSRRQLVRPLVQQKKENLQIGVSFALSR